MQRLTNHSMSFQFSDLRVCYILIKSENATTELFATYKQNEQMKVYLNVQRLGIHKSKRFTDVVTRKHMKAI